MEKGHILNLYKEKRTVFGFKEIALLFGEDNKSNLASKLQYYIKKGYLLRLRKGIYAKADYGKNELAASIYTPAYISFETVLRNEGVIFQHYESIFVASYLTREIKCLNGQGIVYRKLKDRVLLNEQGLIKKDGYFIASKERAFMDMIYLFGDYYFDNLGNIDWKKCEELLDIYENKNMAKKLKSYVELEKS